MPKYRLKYDAKNRLLEFYMKSEDKTKSSEPIWKFTLSDTAFSENEEERKAKLAELEVSTEYLAKFLQPFKKCLAVQAFFKYYEKQLEKYADICEKFKIACMGNRIRFFAPGSDEREGQRAYIDLEGENPKLIAKLKADNPGSPELSELKKTIYFADYLHGRKAKEECEQFLARRTLEKQKLAPKAVPAKKSSKAPYSDVQNPFIVGKGLINPPSQVQREKEAAERKAAKEKDAEEKKKKKDERHYAPPVVQYG